MLPSNASIGIFPQYTSLNCTAELVRHLESSGKWEMGLMEIQYPHCWDNISKDATFEIPLQGEIWQYTLQKGYYLSLSMLMEHVNHHTDPQKRTSAIDSLAVDLVGDPIIVKTNIKVNKILTIFLQTEI
ncbi:hypothetical protein GRJ2_002883600 [Grus japonensis]|uniref:Uncharacterized protein n=1 Tax=Grus japonensis TaxID=30415 RepID=A0ABC9Y4L9_GRUJA